MKEPLEVAWLFHKLNGVRFQEITRVGQKVLPGLMESQIWLLLASAFERGEGSKKKAASPALTLNPDDSVFTIKPWHTLNC